MSPPYLLNVGEAMSGYFEPGCLRPGVPQALAEVGLDFGEPDKDTLSESDPATFSFSLSVWLMVTGLERPELILDGSRSLLVAAPPADLLLTFESMLLVLERCPPLPGIPVVLDLDGRGKLRYCRVVLELTCSTPSSWFCKPSRLVFLPAPDFPPIAADLGIFPRVAEPLVIVAPLAVMMVEGPTPAFLKPKEPAAVDLPMPEGGFFPSSPLLLPASDGERWMEAPLRGVFTFSEALASSVFPDKKGGTESSLLVLIDFQSQPACTVRFRTEHHPVALPKCPTHSQEEERPKSTTKPAFLVKGHRLPSTHPIPATCLGPARLPGWSITETSPTCT